MYLLSTLDATVIQHEKEFNLGIHKYEGDNYVPKGHKYVRDFDATQRFLSDPTGWEEWCLTREIHPGFKGRTGSDQVHP